MRGRMMSFVLAAGLVAVVSWPIVAQEPASAPVQGPMPAMQPAMPPAMPPMMPAPPARRLDLTFDGNGNVTLFAQGVTVREILAEWARKGGSQISGAEGLSGGPVTRQFENRPEIEVLSSLLRQAAGVGLLPRGIGSTGPSRLNVQIKATSNPTAGYTPTSSVTEAPVTTPGFPGDEIPPVQPNPGNQPAQVNPGANTPAQNRPMPGYPNSPVVPVVPVVPVATVPGGPPTPPPPGTGRGGGGR